MTPTCTSVRSRGRAPVLSVCNSDIPSAGKATTDEELEEMLESGNAAVFTAGVCASVHGSASASGAPAVRLELQNLPFVSNPDRGLWHL